MEENEAELKRHLMRVKDKSERAGLKLNIKKAKTMASSPITSWQIEGEMVKDILCQWQSSDRYPLLGI